MSSGTIVLGKLKPKIQCLFEPRVIEYDRKRIGLRLTTCPDVTDEIIDPAGDNPVRHWLRNFGLLNPVIVVTDASHDYIHATFVDDLQ